MDELSEYGVKRNGSARVHACHSLLFFHGGSGILIEVASTPTRTGRGLDSNFVGSHAVGASRKAIGGITDSTRFTFSALSAFTLL
jgi:hypothetical protein